MQDSPDAILQRGHAAETLLKSDIFNGVCEDLLKVYAVKFLASGEYEAKEREALHANARAVQNIRAELQLRIDAAEKLKADSERAEKRKKEI